MHRECKLINGPQQILGKSRYSNKLENGLIVFLINLEMSLRGVQRYIPYRIVGTGSHRLVVRRPTCDVRQIF